MSMAHWITAGHGPVNKNALSKMCLVKYKKREQRYEVIRMIAFVAQYALPKTRLAR